MRRGIDVAAQADDEPGRQIIVAAAAVRGFRPSGKGRLSVQLRQPAGTGVTVTVTQERAAAFRRWLGA